MLEKEFQARFNLLYPHLEEAGRQLRLLQRKRNFDARTKRDGSMVTDADDKMSHYWVELLTQAFPGETVISEEQESTHIYDARDSTIWYVDPIDGTSMFIQGSPNYFVLISLCLAGKASFGILYQPERNCVLYGNPYIQPRLYTSYQNYREIYKPASWHRQLPLIVKGAPPTLRTRLEAVTHLPVRRTTGAAHNIISPLNGPISGFLSFRKTAYWDLAAPSAIMESAGFKTNMLYRGEPVRYNNGQVYCDRYYCLPPDTPADVIDYVTTVTT